MGFQYKKNHYKQEFEEPIFSFVPSIGISEIIKIPNSYSIYLQDNYFVASLSGKHLYRLKFDEKFKKILFTEPIFIGSRIRDIIYSKKNKVFFLALESNGHLGILKVK